MNKKLFFRKFIGSFATTMFLSIPTIVSATNFGQTGNLNGLGSNYGSLQNFGTSSSSSILGGQGSNYDALQNLGNGSLGGTLGGQGSLSGLGNYDALQNLGNGSLGGTLGGQGSLSGLSGSGYGSLSNFGIGSSGNMLNDYSSLLGMGSNYSNLIGMGSNYGGLLNSGLRENYNGNYMNVNFTEIFSKIINYVGGEENKAALEELSKLLGSINENSSIGESKLNIILGALNIRENNEGSDLVTIISNLLINESISANPLDSTSNLLNSIKSSLGNVIDGEISVEGLKPDVVVNDMKATTAGKLHGEENEVKLSGKIYFAETDEKGKPTSNKWVVLIHGFMMDGQGIADSVGDMYLERGINVLAPDLRGFGDSEGKVSMGYMESLDIWDWLTYLNKNYDCEEIFVHGVSLGGATTVYISGMEINGKTMEDQNVIGLIEDSGYSSMTGIIADMITLGGDTELVKSLLGDAIETVIVDLVNVGLTKENFDEYQDGLESVEKCTLPMLIIHGTHDTSVPVRNSESIYDAVMQNDKIPYVQKFIAEGGSHAFITMGVNKNEYEAHLNNFINVSEKIANGEKVEKESTYTPINLEEDELIDILLTTAKLFGNLLFGNL